MNPDVPLRFHVSGLLGAAAVVSIAAALLVAVSRFWPAAIVVGAVGVVLCAVATANYLSQLAFTRWWLAPVFVSQGALPDEFARTFRGLAVRNAAVSMLAALVCSAVCLVARYVSAG